jgi:putative transposase
VAYTLQPWQVFLTALAGWINRHQQAAIEFLREENRVLLEQLGERRIRLTDDQRRGPGRPGVMKEIEKLTVRFARENPSWGYRRIEGALANLGQHVARTTVANLLRRNGIDPAPERGSRTS